MAYYSLNRYLHDKFGEKIYKLALDLALTCPNRDGKKDTRGCIFCLGGSSHFACGGEDVDVMIENAKARVADKTKAKKFIAYFQSYSNTYAPESYLEGIFEKAIRRDDIAALSVATRPDCLPDDIMQMLSRLNKIKPVWIELGLQTSNEKSAEYIRRCYENEVYETAVKRLRERDIEVITHIILGLPGETEEDMLSSVDYAVKCGTTGLKLQLLHVLRGTDLEKDYEKGLFKTMSLEEYCDILKKCLSRIPENIVIHRLTGDAPKALLVSPLWSADKKTVLNTVNRVINEK